MAHTDTPTGPARAVIYAPRDDAQRWIAQCVDHCAQERYDVVHVQVGGADRHWAHLARWLLERRADIIVVARLDHLPATRLPRVEAVSDAPTSRSVAHRRARRLRR